MFTATTVGLYGRPEKDFKTVTLDAGTEAELWELIDNFQMGVLDDCYIWRVRGPGCDYLFS